MKTITRKEIKRKLGCHYGGSFEKNMERRELIEFNHDEGRCLDKGSCVFFFLSGTPPKGYAIYTPRMRRISLYDGHGKRFRILRETVLEERE